MTRTLLAGFATQITEFTPGRRPVLLIHCALAHSGAWTPLARALTAAGSDAQLTGFDLPGHGGSDPWPGQPDLADLATAMARALAERLAAAGPVDVIGHSLGGVVALRLALEASGLVRRLALIEPVLFAALSTQETARLRATQAPMAAALAAGDRASAARHFLAEWGDGQSWESLPARDRTATAARIHLITASAPALWDDAAGLLAPGRLEASSTPTLLLHGDRSPPETATICRRLADRLPQAGVRRIDEAGHMLPVTHAPATADALVDFWRAA